MGKAGKIYRNGEFGFINGGTKDFYIFGVGNISQNGKGFGVSGECELEVHFLASAGGEDQNLGKRKFGQDIGAY